MILRDSVKMTCSPETVWTFIEDPERMKSWNPKIRSTSPISWGDRAIGYGYRLTYAMRNKTSEFLAEITEYRKPEKLVIRLTEGNLPPGGRVNETYELSRTEKGTLLQQTIEVGNSGLNIFVRLLIAFIYRFGKPTGKKHLETLKQLAEGRS